jgi:hypothetical protein
LIYDGDAQNRHTDRLYRPHAVSTQGNKKKLNINFPVFEGGKKETRREEERLLLLLFFLHTFPASNLLSAPPFTYFFRSGFKGVDCKLLDFFIAHRL